MKETLFGLLKWVGLPLALLLSILIGNIWWQFNIVVVILGILSILWVLFLFVMGVRNAIKDFKLNRKNKNVK